MKKALFLGLVAGLALSVAFGVLAQLSPGGGGGGGLTPVALCHPSANVWEFCDSNDALGDISNPIANGYFTALTAVTITISGTVAGNLNITDDNMLQLGTTLDEVLLNQSTLLAADAEVTAVIEGTSEHPGVAANSLIVSNITNDGDILLLISKAGNSQGVFWADGSTGDTAVMASSGQSVDTYIAGTKEIDYATGAMAFQQATTISTTTGALTIDGDDGIILQTTGSGSVESRDAVVLGTADQGTTARTGETLRASDMVGGTTSDAAGADLTIGAGLGTGIGDVGIIDFQLPIVVAAGSTIQTRASRLTLDMVASTTILTMNAAQAMTISTSTGALTLTSTDGAVNVNLGGGAADDFIVDTTTLVVESDNNRVGIGTASPATDLTIKTTSGSGFRMIASNTVNSIFDISDNGTNTLFEVYSTAGDENIRFTTNTSTASWVLSNFGIGTASPAANLDVDGVVRTVTAVSQRAFINNTNAITTNTGATAVYGLAIDEPNITTGSVQATNSASLYISGVATEAVNNYALWVDAGTSRFDGQILSQPETTGTFLDFALETEWTFGTLINADFAGATTQGAGDIIGLQFDFDTNLTGTTDRDITGANVIMNALTQSAANTTTYTGYNISAAGALVQDTLVGTINWRGVAVQMPDITQTTGTVTSIGLQITGGTVTSGSQYGFNVGDDVVSSFGTTHDGVIVLNTAGLAVDAELTNVIEGTSDTLGTAANSLLISNITNDGDIAILASKAGNSYTAFWADGSTGDTALMAATGQSVDVYIAGTKEIDYATGAMAFQQATTISSTVSPLNITTAAGGEVVINDASADVDFRIESDGNANMFTVNGGTNGVGIGQAASAGSVLVAGWDNATMAAGTTAARHFNIQGNITELANAAITDIVGAYFNTFTITDGGGTETVSNVATVYINNAPTVGTTPSNGPYALFVDAGTSRFDGLIAFGGETVDIGTSTVGLNDLHFGSGGIINFDGSDVTITHAANQLTIVGGDIQLDADLDFVGAQSITTTTGNLTIQPAAGGDTIIGDGAIATTIEAVGTLGSGVTTFAVDSNIVTVAGDGGGNTVATITGGVSGQILTILFSDTLITITDTDAHTANTVDLSAAFTSADDTVLQLLFDGTSWYQVSRSNN